MSSGPSWRAAPASAASVCWNPFSFSERYETWISLAVTPLDVAPPLLPLKAIFGGEYGSPGTWSPPGLLTAAAVAPGLAGPPAGPAWPAVPAWPSVPAAPASVGAPVSPAANWSPWTPVPAPAAAAVTAFGDLD